MTEFAFTDTQAGALVEQFLQDLQSRLPEPSDINIEALLNDDNRRQLGVTLAGSLYAKELMLKHPQWLASILAEGNPLPDLHHYSLTLGEQIDAIDGDLKPTAQVLQLDKILRVTRAEAQLRIIWVELNQLAELEIITGHLSALASACIQAPMDFHYRALVGEVGEPVGQECGRVQPLLVLGMGKLGAWELNLSSDIDLIFAYPEHGETRPRGESKIRKTLSNHEFFIRLGQRIIKSLDSQTADGFVFRVDMRLRPYGQSGALAANFGFLEEYYQTQGREWERYAMIKARVVAASTDVAIDPNYCQAMSEQLMELLRPFSYRRYVDFSVINALREMKALINREVKVRRKAQDVKLGHGGIREVEFIGQAFQLVRGGREPQLQERRLLRVLAMLAENGHLPASVVEQLAQAYRFLRRVEHALQAWADRQTQALPMDAEQQARTAYVLGFADWQAFMAELDKTRERVNQEFQKVAGEPTETQSEPPSKPLSLWVGVGRDHWSDTELLEVCNSLALTPAEDIVQQLKDFADNRTVAALSSQARGRLDALMAQLLQGLSEFDWQAFAWPDLPSDLNHSLLLARTLPLLETIARRSAYLVLLIENPGVLPHLLKLFAASSLIAEQICKHPALLEELLDATTLHTVPDSETLRSELEQVMLAIPADDLESQMEALRYFRRAHALRVAACEVSGALPLMKVSDYLTWVAEEIIKQVLELAWNDMVSRYGWPGDQRGTRLDKGFIVVAYGKMGGIELAHGSDLDLVFIHNCDHSGETDGDKVIDVQTFYTRLGQKIIHILNTRTQSGRLYEVDMRLRPSGNSGLLVSSLSAFERYQREQAWTWEHQALLRARPVAGSAGLVDEFNQLRQSVLCEPRDRETLRQEVVEMRDKMRSHLSSKAGQERFDLKQDRGGIVDIEFMVQYAALAWAGQYPELVRYSDNIRILEGLANVGLLDNNKVAALTEAYKTYRATGHRLALQQQAAELPGQAMAEFRAQVSAIWQELMEPVDAVDRR